MRRRPRMRNRNGGRCWRKCRRRLTPGFCAETAWGKRAGDGRSRTARDSLAVQTEAERAWEEADRQTIRKRAVDGRGAELAGSGHATTVERMEPGAARGGVAACFAGGRGGGAEVSPEGRPAVDPGSARSHVPRRAV